MRPAARHAVGVDVGSTTTKVALLPLGDRSRSTAIGSLPTPADATSLWEAVRGLLEASFARFGLPAAIGLASMAESGVPLGRGDEPLTPILRWDGAGPATRVAGLTVATRERHFVATGLCLAPKTTWSLLDDALYEPRTRLRFRRWVGVADWLLLKLTGSYATDATLAGRTALYTLGMTPTADFASDLGLSPDQLPPVSSGPYPTRALESLPAGVPVLVAGHDHAVGAWGAGMRAPGHLVESFGTAEAVTLGARHPIDRLLAFRQGTSLSYAVAGFESVMAGNPAAGRLVAMWRDRHPDEQLPLSFGPPYDDLVAPYPLGRQAPHPDPAAVLRAASGADPLDLPPQALLEAIAYQAQWLAETAAGLAGAPERVTLLGSAVSANPGWARLKASLVGCLTDVCTAAEPVAEGAALLAAVRAGVADPEINLPCEPVEPLPDGLTSRYREAQEAFVRFALTPNPTPTTEEGVP